jgi:bifunctional polynucleotide phosphatase/kinase
VSRPILLYAANGYTHCRKPHTGIFSQYLLPLIGAGRIKEILYVGDAAGRKGDHSDSDRKFLMNIALYVRSKKIDSGTPHFQEPEQYFEGKKATPFVLSGLNPQKFIKTIKNGKKLSELDTSIKHLKGDKQEVILMIGAPATGKTSMAKRMVKEWDYVWINQDRVGTKKNVDKELEQVLKKGKSVVLDSTNGSATRREEQIDIAKEYFRKKDLPIHIRAFVMNGNYSEAMQKELAHHMNLVRERSTNNPRIPAIAYRMYYSRYSPPSESEGFTQIQNVEFLPRFPTTQSVLNFLQRT